MLAGPFFWRLCLVGGGWVILNAFADPGRAELAWKQSTVELHADAKSTVLEARFPFTNKGSAPVDLTQVESSCGCTVVSLEKRHYAPNESGEIAARYTVGAAVGDQSKTVLVSTGDGHPPKVLTLNIHIPEVLRIRPAFVSWTHGETPAAKKITLEMMQDEPIRDLTVQSSSVALNADVKTLVPNRRYELIVQPQRTDQTQFSTLTIRCRFGGEERVFRAYATVHPATLQD